MNTREKMIFKHNSGGGPCSGKSTGQARIVDYGQSLGFNVLACPEAATMVFASGIERDRDLQKNILNLQLKHEDFYTDAATLLTKRTNKPTLITFDRGLLDGLAYVDDPKEFENLLAFYKLSKYQILENRYDVTTHLVTAANGAAEFYTNENNIHRPETPKQAIMRDQRLQESNSGAKNYGIIGNRLPDGAPKSFEKKIRQQVTAVFGALGVPSPIENERKWIVDKVKFQKTVFADKKIATYTAKIVQTYLRPSPQWDEERVRMKITENGEIFFFHTKKKRTADPQRRIETEKLINLQTYNQLLLRIDTERRKVEKTRTSFIWNEQVFTLDEYNDTTKNYLKLEREGTMIEETITPDFLPILKEVTEDFRYSEHFSALHDNVG